MIVVALATALTGAAIIAPRASAATACVNQIFGPSNTYQQCVNYEQVLLNDLWYHGNHGVVDRLLTVDGYYGPNTSADVKFFNDNTNDTIDGTETSLYTWYDLCYYTYSNGFHGTFWYDVGCNLDYIP